MGVGDDRARFTPVRVPGLSGVVSIAAGRHFSLAVTEDGSVFAWGSNSDGQLGIGARDFDIHLEPLRIEGINDAVSIAAGAEHAVAVTRDGSAWVWGRNWYGQLGTGNNSESLAPYNDESPTPILCRNIDSILMVAASGDHTVFLKQDGTVWVCGRTKYGRAGKLDLASNFPIKVPGIENAIYISAGENSTTAVTSDGVVYGWGGIGIYSEFHHPEPTQVAGINVAIQAVTGGTHTLFILVDGSVWSLGSNSIGQLGIGKSGGKSDIPVQVLHEDGTAFFVTRQ